MHFIYELSDKERDANPLVERVADRLEVALEGRGRELEAKLRSEGHNGSANYVLTLTDPEVEVSTSFTSDDLQDTGDIDLKMYMVLGKLFREKALLPLPKLVETAEE
jgi:hypothetical protein